MRRREVLGLGLALAATGARGSGPPPAVARYEELSGGHVGFHAENVRTGRRLAWRGDERFVMCSTFKASLAALVLHRVDRHRDTLDDRIAFGAADIPDWHAPVAKAHVQQGSLTVREICAGAVEQSDNTCANLLLARVGGPPVLTAFWRGIGDTTSRLDDTEPVLNRTPPGGVRNTTTPRAMTETLQKLVLRDVLSDASRRTLTAWLVGCQTGANRLRLGLPADWVIGDKTGNNGTDAAGDIAVTWTPAKAPIVLAVYTRGGAPSVTQLEEVFAGIARLVAASLG